MAFKDSGNRREFGTGAVRDGSRGKGRMDLVPPFATFFLSRIFEDGCLKYGSRNWEKGIPVDDYVDSAQRHLEKYKAGMRDEPHLSMAFWNIACALTTAAWVRLGLRPKTLFSLPNHVGTGPADPLSAHEQESLRTFIGRDLPKA